jgi:uncharacterized repeat protein (TIGR01451 family)
VSRWPSRIGLVAAALAFAGSLTGASAVRAAESAPPTISISFDTQGIGMVNGWSTLTIVVTNPNADPLTGVEFTDTLSAGIIFANPDSVLTNCSVWPTLGVSTVSLFDATLEGGASCSVSIDVLGIGSGPQTSTTDAVTCNEGGSGNSDSANLYVAYPADTRADFAEASIPFGGSTMLKFSVTNPNSQPSAPGVRPAALSEFFGTLTDLGFVDTLPAGLVVATPNGVTNSCGGTVTAIPGTRSVTLAGASLDAGASCTITVDVNGVGAGNQQNSTGPVNSAEGGPGDPGIGSIVVGDAPLPTATPAVTPPSSSTDRSSHHETGFPAAALLLLVACWLLAAVAIGRSARSRS